MIIHKPSLLHIQKLAATLPVHQKPKQQHHNLRFSKQWRPKISLDPCKCSSESPRSLGNYDEDDNVIGDCVVFEDGIFEDPPILSANKQHRNISKKNEEEEEEESLIPEEWQDLQKELNISKKERKKRMLRFEAMTAFEKKREIELFRDGLSQYNKIKLPELKFPANFNNREAEESNVEGRVLSPEKSEEGVSVSGEETEIKDQFTEFSSVRCGDKENGSAEVMEISSVEVGSSREVTEISSVEDEKHSEEIENESLLQKGASEGRELYSVRDEEKQSVGFEVNKPSVVSEGVLGSREGTGISFLIGENDETCSFEVNKPYEGSVSQRVLPRNPRQVTGVYSVNERILPRNPRREVVGAGFEDISRRLKKEYGRVEADEDTREEERPKERQQLYTPEEKALLNSHVPDLRRATSAKWIPLHTFATAGQSYLLDYLLTHDVDINATDKDGRTALHKAISCKKQGIVSYLLNAGADALVRDRDGATLMHYAVEVAAIQIIKLLILYKVDVNLPDNYGWTPLHLAVQSRRTDVVRLLLVKGADKNIQNKDGNTPLDLCLHSGRYVRTYELLWLLKTLPKNRLQNSVSVGNKLQSNIHSKILK